MSRKPTPSARIVAVLGLAMLLVGCSSASQGTPPAGSSPSGSTSTSASPSKPPLTLVVFGDSWPYGTHCGGCTPFPDRYWSGLKAATGREVTMVNQTTNGGTAASLLDDIKNTPAIRQSLKRADIVVIATGGNDLSPAFDATHAGTCGGADKLDCFRTVMDSLRTSFDGILTEIEGLRNGQPTATRLVTQANEFLTDGSLLYDFGPEFGKGPGVAITRMQRDVQCEVAAKHHAKCVDTGLALNGPDLLKPTDTETSAGMQAVADAILASGLDELQLH
jgi:lysophospholipase L1-like esterase